MLDLGDLCHSWIQKRPSTIRISPKPIRGIYAVEYSRRPTRTRQQFDETVRTKIQGVGFISSSQFRKSIVRNSCSSCHRENLTCDNIGQCVIISKKRLSTRTFSILSFTCSSCSYQPCNTRRLGFRWNTVITHISVI